MMRQMKNTVIFPFFIAVAVLAFHACSDGSSPEKSCPSSLPEFLAFNAKWVSADTVQLFYATEPLINHSENYLYWIICHMYHSEAPEGPWEYVYTDSLYSGLDSSRLNYMVRSPGKLNFFRLTVEYVCSGETKHIEGPMIATRRPVSHPSEWDAGPDLVSPVVTSLGGTGGTVISEDGLTIIAEHREGRIFSLQTGADITPQTNETKQIYIYGPAKWTDSLLYSYGGSFVVYNILSRNKICDIPGKFSYSLNDTAYVVHDHFGNKLVHFNTDTQSLHLVQSSFTNPYSLTNTTSSPSYSLLGCYLGNGGTPNQGEYMVLKPDFSIFRLVSPFGMTDIKKQLVPLYGWLDYHYIIWGNDDDRMFFWTTWSGSQEIWTYSIAKNEYKQVTGYRMADYPGKYIDCTGPSDSILSGLETLNFVYNHTKNTLILFFRRDVYSYAMRFVPVTSL